jgi:hypothetical protein
VAGTFYGWYAEQPDDALAGGAHDARSDLLSEAAVAAADGALAAGQRYPFFCGDERPTTFTIGPGLEGPDDAVVPVELAFPAGARTVTLTLVPDEVTVWRIDELHCPAAP